MDSSTYNELIAEFEKLGLSQNEAKVYLALRESYPITGYQLAKNSGILRPVVYEMLNRLTEKGGAKVIKSNPDTYVPVDLNEFLKNLENNFSEAKSKIEKFLKDNINTDSSDYFWNIISEKNILNAIISMVDRAEKEILLEVNSEYILTKILKILNEKKNPNINITFFSYFNLDTEKYTLYNFNLKKNFNHPIINKDSAYIVTDNLEAIVLYLTQSDPKNSKAVYSKNICLVYGIKEKIQKNIYMVRLWKYIGKEKLKLILNDEDRSLLEFIDKNQG